MYWQRTCSQSKWTVREGITSLWNSKLQETGWKIHNVLLPNQNCSPYLLTIQKTCCCQWTDFAVLLLHGRGEKLVGALKKVLLGDGGGLPVFCHSGWVFILSSIKRNMCHVFHTRICTVFVLMLNAVLACSAKDLLVIFTQPWHQRNSAFKGTADTIPKQTHTD